MKLNLNVVRLRKSTKQPLAEFIDGEWWIKSDYPNEQSIAGTFTILRADGSVWQRTIDEQGFIVHETCIRERS